MKSMQAMLAMSVAFAGALTAAGELTGVCDDPSGKCLQSNMLLQQNSGARKVQVHMTEDTSDEVQSDTDSKWHVTYSNWPSSMIIEVLVTIGGVKQDDGVLGAWIEGELRGVSKVALKPPFGPYKGKSIYPIFIYGDSPDNNKKVTFKFKQADGTVVALKETKDYETGGKVGNVVFPYKLTGDAPATPAPTPPPTMPPTPPPTPAPTTAPAPAAAAWAVVPSDFSDSMSLQALVTVGGVEQAAGTLAAFVGSTVHGVQDTPLIPPFGPKAGKSIYAITIFGNGSDKDKPISFEFKAVDGTVSKLSTTVDFEVNGNIGNVIFPHGLSG